uniref:Protein argonaute-3 n=1 Tax=Cacopsylla melanoneura TaxID=428564 RepID=A0A8D9B6J8_9HEMI
MRGYSPLVLEGHNFFLNWKPEILHFITGGEDKLTPNEVLDLFGSKGDVAYKAEDLFHSKEQDVKVGAWKQEGVHNLTVGYTTYQDKDLLQQYVYKPYRFARIVELNCKLGGSLWSVKIPYNCSMVVGIDVYHEGVGSQGQNVVGLVSSTNRDYTSYYSQAVIQRRGQEITSCIAQPFKQALDKYIQVNGVDH